MWLCLKLRLFLLNGIKSTQTEKVQTFWFLSQLVEYRTYLIVIVEIFIINSVNKSGKFLMCWVICASQDLSTVTEFWLLKEYVYTIVTICGRKIGKIFWSKKCNVNSWKINFFLILYTIFQKLSRPFGSCVSQCYTSYQKLSKTCVNQCFNFDWTKYFIFYNVLIKKSYRNIFYYLMRTMKWITSFFSYSFSTYRALG